MSMKWKKTNTDTFYFNEKVNLFGNHIGKQDMSFLIKKSFESTDNKSRLCLHKNTRSSLHQMIIFHKKNYKVKIHKHLATEESYLLLKGKMKVKFYDKHGLSKQTVTLSANSEKLPFFINIPKNTFHNQEFIEDTIFFEIKNGPFRKKNDRFL